MFGGRGRLTVGHRNHGTCRVQRLRSYGRTVALWAADGDPQRVVPQWPIEGGVLGPPQGGTSGSQEQAEASAPGDHRWDGQGRFFSGRHVHDRRQTGGTRIALRRPQDVAQQGDRENACRMKTDSNTTESDFKIDSDSESHFVIEGARPRRVRPWTRLVLWPIHLYQRAMEGRPSPCRFTPSCSTYAVESLETHGLLKGSRLAIWRILRCNPWGGQGFDPVPPARSARHRCSSSGSVHHHHNHQKAN